MDNLTIIIPLQIESEDRLRNTIAVLSYLIKNFPTSQIIVKEVDVDSKFLNHAFPKIKKNCGEVKNLNHIFHQSDKLFNKSSVINDMVLMSETDIVLNYDIDVLLPLKAYTTAYDLILNGVYDIIYPYGCGVYQYNVLNFNSLVDDFFLSNFDLNQLIPQSQKLPSVQGWCQMFNKKTFIENYGFNENFIFVGYEDTEFLYRMSSFGVNIGRVDDNIYHLDHVRVHNKNYNDKEFFEKNIMLWEWIRKQDKETIQKYYNSQEYVSKFK